MHHNIIAHLVVRMICHVREEVYPSSIWKFHVGSANYAHADSDASRDINILRYADIAVSIMK